MKFAKLIEIENNEQVLLLSDYNDDTEKYEIKVMTDLDNCRACVTLSFDNEEIINDILNNYSLEKAKLFRLEMEKQFEL